MMIFGSLFSGIEAASVAWEPLGWRCAWVAEIDKFASAVLAHHYPDVPNLGDVTEIDSDAVEPVDLIVFGSPCQSFSVAGKRLGLDDPRGNLALVALRLVERIRPRWMVFENVPGLLSSDGGRDFGAFLGLLGECGYGYAYRVYDAQFAGVPQRRRRVFVVGYLGDWRPPAAVLFEPESLRGDTAPRRETGQRIARPIAGCTPGGSGYRNDADTAENLIARSLNAHPSRIDGESETFVALAVTADQRHAHPENGRGTVVAHSLRADGFDASEDGTGRGTPLVPVMAAGNSNSNGAGIGLDGDPMFTIDTTGAHAVAFQEAQTGVREYADSGSLRANGPGHDPVGTRIRSGMSVRRLTPRECERLQGFPDNWTAITYRGKPASDGPRYRALGNSMAVPVIRWLGERIQHFEDATSSLSKESAVA